MAEAISGNQILNGNPMDEDDEYVLHISMDQRRVRSFEGLARRPRQVDGDAFDGLLFGVDTIGDIWSFDATAAPVPFFEGGLFRISTGAEHVRGLSISATPLHRNEFRRFDEGHGLPMTFDDTRGGALTLRELEPNDTFGTAVNLDDGVWSLQYVPHIGDDEDPPIVTSTFLPHISIEGTGEGSIFDGTANRDFYSFSVTEPGSYVQLEIDFSFDTQLHPNGLQPGIVDGVMDPRILLYDGSGGLIAIANDFDPFTVGAGGPVNTFDGDDPGVTHEPYLDMVLEPGVYIVEVQKLDPETLAFTPPEEGDRYTLQVTVEDHETRAGREDGGSSLFFGSGYTGVIEDVSTGSDITITSPGPRAAGRPDGLR